MPFWKKRHNHVQFNYNLKIENLTLESKPLFTFFDD